MKHLKVVDRANGLLDRGIEAKAAIEMLVQDATIEEKVEWFDEVAGSYLVHQLAYERRKSGESAGPTG